MQCENCKKEIKSSKDAIKFREEKYLFCCLDCQMKFYHREALKIKVEEQEKKGIQTTIFNF